jgi:hypothetical protein
MKEDSMRAHVAMLGIALLTWTVGCSDGPAGPDGSANSAVITGRIISADGSSKMAQGCDDAIVSLNGIPATVAFDDDCEFVVTGVEPTELLQVRIELPTLEVSGTVEINNVKPGELIEIEVETTEERLSVTVLRRAEFEPSDQLPSIVSTNNVHMVIGSGVFSEDLTVRGNNFGLLGEAGDSCDDGGWTVISGDVLVLGNNATFRNIAFTGDVRVMGRNVRFINSCFDGALVRFGREPNRSDDDDDDEDDDDD